MTHYPRIYLACHRRHVKDPGSSTTLSAHQASILDHLDAVEPTAVGELAAHMGVTVGTMSIAVDRLARAGYVRRERDRLDARRVHLRLTESGVRIRGANSVLDPELVRDMLAMLSAAELSAALDGLSLLAEAADRVSAMRSVDRSSRASDGVAT